MPFTLAHPAIVLPLGKPATRLSLTALIAGSIAPDFEFFFQLKEVENIGHHWYGILLFDLPVALLFCYLFHGLLKTVLVHNLPAYYRDRFMPLLFFNWRRFAARHKTRVLVSILTGVLSHIAWDGFTHADGVFVLAWPALSHRLHLAGTNIPVYYVLQIVFSLGGMWVVHYTITQLPSVPSSISAKHKNRYFWPLLWMVFIIILTIRIYGWPQYNSFWSIVMAAMGGMAYAWVLSTIFIQSFILQKK